LSDLEDSSLLGCYVVLNGKQLLMFQRITVPSLFQGQVVQKMTTCLTMKMIALWFLTTWAAVYNMTRPNIPEDLDLQQMALRTSDFTWCNFCFSDS